MRPILEYGNTVRSNGLKKYMNKIENVQRRFTKLIKNFHNLPYEERLKLVNLPSLEYRQLRGDMIQVFKIARNFYDCSSTESICEFVCICVFKNKKLRGHPYKINKQFTNTTKIKNFFSNRVVNKWNSLPHEVVQSKTINEFKNIFDLLNKDIMYKIDINYHAP